MEMVFTVSQLYFTLLLAQNQNRMSHKKKNCQVLASKSCLSGLSEHVHVLILLQLICKIKQSKWPPKMHRFHANLAYIAL